jgi:ATP-dependent helicase/nuclease subunit B
MSFDVMIVSNLNEGEFIAQGSTQNWLSRSMRLDFGLPDLTRRVGVSAHDFNNYLGNKKVFLTRSSSSNNAPTSKLRFLMKLETILKATKLFDNLDDGKYWHFLLKQFNAVEDSSKNVKQVANPNLEHRIKRASVTDIGKWIKDPYYIYAKRVLNLKALNKIDEEASFANFGNFVHETLEEFVKDYEKVDKDNALEILLEDYAKKCFVKYFVSKDSYLLWWPRFENIALWFIKNEVLVRKNLKDVLIEVPAQMEIDGLKITTKIDRVNIDLEGNIEIIDYKTGLVPTNSNVKKGLEPQLPLEALILLNNKGFEIGAIKNLQYYALKGRDKNKINNIGDPQILIESANDGIEQLIKIFNKSQTPFYANANPEIYKENEYTHLARIDVA